MLDPLSLALAGVTLATALKDAIEVAEKVHESFKKPALNMRATESLAAETLEIVNGLKNFYDGHKEMLDNSSEMRDAVLRLLSDMNTVYEKCKPIIQASDSSDSKLRRIKYTIGAWRNRNDLEKYINNIRDRANKCHIQFMMFAVMRIEATTVQIRGAVADGFARARDQPPPLRVSDDNVLAFLGSAPLMLSHLPPHVQLSEHLVYRSFIIIQVGKIDTLFKNPSSSGSYPIEKPDIFHLRPFRSTIWLRPCTKEGIEDVQSAVFAMFPEIQESLSNRRGGLSIQRGAKTMSDLSVWLINLGMYQESLKIALCAADIYRTLANVNEDVHGSHLAHVLHLQSQCFVATGDLVEAYKTITEAVTLGRRLASSTLTFEAQSHLAELVFHSAYVGRLNMDSTNALQDAEEAVQGYEGLFGKPASIVNTGLSGAVDIASGPNVLSRDGTRVFKFAEALAELHYSLSSTTRKVESMKAGIEALELYSALEQKHYHGAFSNAMAALCYSLASSKFRDMISDNEALSYAHRSSYQYEKILQSTGVVPNGLPATLAREAKLLSRMKRFDEAYAVCQRIKSMIQNHIDDQRLRAESFLRLTEGLSDSKHHAEAALAGDQLLVMYQSLLSRSKLRDAYEYTSRAFGKAGDHEKSLQLAEAAVNHWRALAFQDVKHLKYVAYSLLNRAHTLLRAADYTRAFNEGLETLKLFSQLIEKDASLLKDYRDALCLIIIIIDEAKMDLNSVSTREVFQHCRFLAKRFADQRNIFIGCVRIFVRSLEDLGDSSAIIAEALSWFDASPAHDPDSAKLHIYCLLDSGKILRDQGRPDKASSVYEEAIRIGKPHESADPVIFSILWTRASNILALYDMGQLSLALIELEECLKLASEHDTEKEESYTWFLDLVSLIYRWSGRVDDALFIIRRSISIDKEHGGIPSSSALSDLLADSGQEEEALRVAYEAVEESEVLKIYLTTSEMELYCVRAQYSLALCLFSYSDFSQARELLIEVRLFYQQHSQTRKIWCINLAVTLWAEGFLECASGRHEEGIAARNQLNDLRKCLRLIFPNLDGLVEVGLNRERNFTAWKNLLKKFKLTCGHQEDEFFLK